MIQIGTAGWAIPRDTAGCFGAGASALARYATRFGVAEINSSFHRPHRPGTYARWADAVPGDFRFAVKLPKVVTHDAGLVGSEAAVDRFLDETSHLGAKRGPILVQTPPKLAFERGAVATLVARLTDGGAPSIVWEPRHASWFEPDVGAWLAEHRIARVAADPARQFGAGEPGGWPGLAYHRLHGSPRMYYSGYDCSTLSVLAAAKIASGGPAWIIFDNTASGEAARNALTLEGLVSNAENEP